MTIFLEKKLQKIISTRNTEPPTLMYIVISRVSDPVFGQKKTGFGAMYLWGLQSDV